MKLKFIPTNMIQHADKKAISDHLSEAKTRDGLLNSQIARLLNLNPCYITWCLNPKYWSSMSKTSWERLHEWHVSREKISDFKIPEGEEIFKAREKVATNASGSKSQTAPQDPLPAGGNLKIETRGPVDTITPDKIKLKAVRKPRSFTGVLETTNPDPAKLRVLLDIEINLILNGQKIRLN